MTKSPRHLLIVDDSAKNIQFLGAVLRDEGYLVSVAMDGMQAIERTKSIMPDVILMDIMMPVMDGLEACRVLKQDSETLDIPVIFLSAKSEPEDVAEALAAGGNDYVRKPFQAVEILQRIETQLRIADLQHQLKERARSAEESAEKVLQMAREYSSFTRHELSNILGPILGYSDMLLRKQSIPDDKKTAWIQQIRQSAVSMKSLLAAIKQLQDVEEGLHELVLRPVELSRILMQEIRVSEMAFGNELKFVYSLAEDPLLVDGDVELLAGVFRNLLKNALEHVLDIRASGPLLYVEGKLVADSVRIQIRNGGTPIPGERLKTFFDRFNSTKRGRGGTGLGTSFAKSVIEAHGGRIAVASNADSGTLVEIHLPCSTQAERWT